MRIRTITLATAAMWSLSLQSVTGQVLVYEFDLSGAAESPPVASPGTGSALVTIDVPAATMRVQAEFSGLLGTTTAAHIHCCNFDAMMNASVATQTPSFSGFPTGVTSGMMDTTFDMTLAGSYRAGFITDNGGAPASAFAALIAGLNGLEDGTAYFNIHTTEHTGGEIRGFAVLVPEPSTVALTGLGLLAMAPWFGRRVWGRRAE